MNRPVHSPDGKRLAVGPTYALVEVLIHELANPVQAARTAVHLWQSEQQRSEESRTRLNGLDAALDRVSAVIKTIQAVKESSLIPPSSVSSEKLLADIRLECSVADVVLAVEEWPRTPVDLRVHAAALPVLLASWAGMTRDQSHSLCVGLRQNGARWTLYARVRPGQADSVVRHGMANEVAGYPAAIGEFMIAAGGSTAVLEDNLGTFELDIDIAAWVRSE